MLPRQMQKINVLPRQKPRQWGEVEVNNQETKDPSIVARFDVSFNIKFKLVCLEDLGLFCFIYTLCA